METLLKSYLPDGFTKAISDGILPSEILAFEKGLDKSKLVKKRITTKDGHSTTKWVRAAPKGATEEVKGGKVTLSKEDYNKKFNDLYLGMVKDFDKKAGMYKKVVNNIPEEGLSEKDVRTISDALHGFSRMMQVVSNALLRSVAKEGETSVAREDVPDDFLEMKKLGGNYRDYANSFHAEEIYDGHNFTGEYKKFSKAKVKRGKEKLNHAIDLLARNSEHFTERSFLRYHDGYGGKNLPKYLDINHGFTKLIMMDKYIMAD